MTVTIKDVDCSEQRGRDMWAGSSTKKAFDRRDHENFADTINDNPDAAEWSADAMHQALLLLQCEAHGEGDSMAAAKKIASNCRSAAEYEAVFRGTAFYDDFKESDGNRSMFDPALLASSRQAADRLRRYALAYDDPATDPRVRAALDEQFGGKQGVLDAANALEKQADVMENQPELIDLDREVAQMKTNLSQCNSGLSQVTAVSDMVHGTPAYAANQSTVPAPAAERLKNEDLTKKYADPDALLAALDRGELKAEDLTPQAMLLLQRQMEKESRLYNLISNLLKVDQDRAMAAVNNMRG